MENIIRHQLQAGRIGRRLKKEQGGDFLGYPTPVSQHLPKYQVGTRWNTIYFPNRGIVRRGRTCLGVLEEALQRLPQEEYGKLALYTLNDVSEIHEIHNRECVASGKYKGLN